MSSLVISSPQLGGGPSGTPVHPGAAQEKTRVPQPALRHLSPRVGCVNVAANIQDKITEFKSDI